MYHLVPPHAAHLAVITLLTGCQAIRGDMPYPITTSFEHGPQEEDGDNAEMPINEDNLLAAYNTTAILSTNLAVNVSPFEKVCLNLNILYNSHTHCLHIYSFDSS